jgi:hypothetical protein
MNMDDRTIKVWQWEDAPEELQSLSTHGGDEDWVALVPVALKGIDLYWARPGSPFGCCDVDVIECDDGSTVYIGAHA